MPASESVMITLRGVCRQREFLVIRLVVCLLECGTTQTPQTSKEQKLDGPVKQKDAMGEPVPAIYNFELQMFARQAAHTSGCPPQIVQ